MKGFGRAGTKQAFVNVYTIEEAKSAREAIEGYALHEQRWLPLTTESYWRYPYDQRTGADMFPWLEPPATRFSTPSSVDSIPYPQPTEARKQRWLALLNTLPVAPDPIAPKPTRGWKPAILADASVTSLGATLHAALLFRWSQPVDKIATFVSEDDQVVPWKPRAANKRAGNYTAVRRPYAGFDGRQRSDAVRLLYLLFLTSQLTRSHAAFHGRVCNIKQPLQ
jgi:hypothetical protein